jgi:hypothetical protein
LTLLALLLCSGLTTGLPLGRRSSPGTNGAYKGICRGELEGEVTVVVSPAGVTIVGQVKDQKSGKKSAFVSATLAMENGRFSGTALAGLTTVRIVGRVEPKNEPMIKTNRVICTLTDGNNASRLLATKSP